MNKERLPIATNHHRVSEQPPNERKRKNQTIREHPQEKPLNLHKKTQKPLPH
ncbi:hypothetical protein A2U01_0118632, partial [Trifolium medium]|nr:hypothetical protein [Trifolium medium]